MYHQYISLLSFAYGVSLSVGCTAVLVGRGASIDGSLMTTHNNDCMECDSRMARTPAKEYLPGALKTVYRYKSDYPHMVNNQRSPVWQPNNLDPELVQSSTWSTQVYIQSLTLGTFPEVEKTYALVEGVYGIMNEVGLGIGESTCSSIWYGKPPRACYDCEGPLVDIAFLSLVALERCETARCAIQLMGDLASELGFYASEQTQEEGGEALTIIDTHEAWMFHILPDQSGNGAVWAAQRVPDDHVSVCANAFVIRGIDPVSSDFMFSDNLHSEAKKTGLWPNPQRGPLDFAKTFGAVEKAYSEMITRRVWRVFDLVAPHSNLPDETDYLGDGLPFSVKVEKKLSAKDVMAIKRDYFQGTRFDLSKGVAGGPYGDPRRFDGSIDKPWNHDNLTAAEAESGAFERSISVMRTAYSTVLVSRASSPANELTRAVVWVAQYAPHLSVYTPIYVAAGDEAVPLQLTIGSLWKFDNSSAYWRACLLGNWVSHFFRYAYPDMQTVQNLLEDRALEDQKEVEVQAKYLLEQGDEEGAKSVLVLFSVNHCNDFVHAYKKLFEIMVAKFHDGYNLADQTSSTPINMQCLFYPKWWLKVAGYWSKFDKPMDYQPFGTSHYPDTAINTTDGNSGVTDIVKPDSSEASSVEPIATTEMTTTPRTFAHRDGWMVLASCVLLSFTTGCLGYVLGKTRNASSTRKSGIYHQGYGMVNSEEGALNEHISFHGTKYDVGVSNMVKVNPQAYHVPVGSIRSRLEV